MLWSLRPTHPDHFIAGRHTQQRFGPSVNRNTTHAGQSRWRVIRLHWSSGVRQASSLLEARPHLRQPFRGQDPVQTLGKIPGAMRGRISQRGGSNRARLRVRDMIRLMVRKGLLTLVAAVGAWAQGSPTNRPQFSAEAVETGTRPICAVLRILPWTKCKRRNARAESDSQRRRPAR